MHIFLFLIYLEKLEMLCPFIAKDFSMSFLKLGILLNITDKNFKLLFYYLDIFGKYVIYLPYILCKAKKLTG